MKSFVHRVIAALIVCVSLSMISGCGWFKSKRPADAPYIKGGINFHLQGDNLLNLYQQKPHALILCVYQLKDANAFNQILEEKDGAPKLLECSRFDGSVNYAKRMIVQPGKDLYEAMELIEGTTMLGVVAGYYHFDKKKAVMIIPLPKKGVPMFRKPGGTIVALYLTDQGLRNWKEGRY